MTNTGCLLTTSDNEIGEIDPVPSGCVANRADGAWPNDFGGSKVEAGNEVWLDFSLATPTAPISATASPPPLILSIQTASGQPVGQQGESVTLTGEFLTSAQQVTLTHTKLGIRLRETGPA